MSSNIPLIHLDLTTARREQRQRLARLAELRLEIADLQAHVALGTRLVNRLTMRRRRAVAATKATT